MAVARAAADVRTWDPACGLGVDCTELQPRGNPRPTARSCPTPSQGAGEDGHILRRLFANFGFPAKGDFHWDSTPYPGLISIVILHFWSFWTSRLGL